MRGVGVEKHEDTKQMWEASLSMGLYRGTEGRCWHWLGEMGVPEAERQSYMRKVEQWEFRIERYPPHWVRSTLGATGTEEECLRWLQDMWIPEKDRYKYMQKVS